MVKHFLQPLIAICLLCALGGCRSKSGRATPEENGVIWGFTTQNFISAMPVSCESSLRHIDFARSHGYRWIELRDPDADLSSDECRVISDYAEQQGIDVVYSVQRGFLAEDFQPIVTRALENARFFNGPRLLRVLALRGKHPLGWTENEFSKVKAMSAWAAEMARRDGYRLMVENADVILDGTPHGCCGLRQFMENVDPLIELQLDSANLFTGATGVDAVQAEEFIRAYAERTTYLHLKSARGGVALPVIEDNPLAFATILEILTGSQAVLYAAIELASDSNDIGVIEKNMRISMDRLVKDKLITDFDDSR